MKRILSLVLCGLLFSCHKQEATPTEALKGQVLSENEFFEKIVQAEMSSEKVLLISYELNSQDGTIRLMETQSTEPSWGLAFEIAEVLYEEAHPTTPTATSNKVSYKVVCSNGSSSWTKDCSGQWGCGSTVYECLKQGGCATICTNKMVYVPKSHTFYIDEQWEKFIDPEEILKE